MNFKESVVRTQSLPVFTSAIIHKLMAAISMGAPAVHEGVTYTPSQVAQMMKNQSAGIKPTKVSIYAGDFCMTQGVVISPKVEDYTMEYPVKSASSTIDVPYSELPVNAGVVDLREFKVGGKRYYLPLEVKEDIKIFASLFKYADTPSLNKKTWTYIPSPNSVWAEHGFYSPNIPYQALESIQLDRTMAGQDLIEYLYLHKDLWPVVRTVVWAMLRDVTVPELDIYGNEVLDEDGEIQLEYANGEMDYKDGDNSYCFLDRFTRPAPVVFKCASDPYQADMQIEKAKEQVGVNTLLETHNDYLDGIDYSINCNNIRNKITVLANLDLSKLPLKIGVVTNQQEEFAVLSKFFADNYKTHTLIHLTEKSAHNYSGFKMFMKPTSTLKPMDIHDKAAVSRSMQRNTQLIRAIRAGEYPEGFGFMTAPMIEHYFDGNEPTETKGPGTPSEYIDLPEGRAFKQLHSSCPLSFFPYVSGKEEFVKEFESRTMSIIENLRLHLWILVNYPVTRQTYAEQFPDEIKLPTLKWTPGKTATSIAFELDSEFQGYAQVVKASKTINRRERRNESLVLDRVDNNPPVIIKSKDKVKEPEKLPLNPFQLEVKTKEEAPPPSIPSPPLQASPRIPEKEEKSAVFPKDNKREKKNVIKRRKQTVVDASDLAVNDDSDAD